MYDVAVIGFGMAGVKAALDAVLYNAKTAIFTGGHRNTRRARSTWVLHGYENVPGLHDVSTPEVIAKVRKQITWGPLAHNATFFKEAAVGFAVREEGFEISAESGKTVAARFVILALGATDEQPEIPLGSGNIREIFPYANGSAKHTPSVHYCIRCDGHLVHGKPFAVIGHTKTAAAVAEILVARSAIVDENGKLIFRPEGYLFLHGREFKGPPERVEELEAIGVQTVPETIVEITGKPREAKLEGFSLAGGKLVEVPIAFVALGMRNNETELVGPLKAAGVTFDDLNAIVVDDRNETTLPGVFALGDGVAGRPRQICSHWSDSQKIIKALEPYLKKKIFSRLTEA